ncbi:MAG: hypothetical protein WAN93_10020 [Solirubrobacteraceae bacterium]
MFSRVRSRVTYANVAMTLALVFAMTGGAYAAGKYVITSTKQISPKVLKGLKSKGPAGAAGAVGPEGKAGAPGAAGKDGAAGLTGKEGSQGLQGSQGPQGPKGATGATGEPWTAGGTLPSGKTETGTWVYRGNKENGAVGSDAVSFTIPLTNTSNVEFVYTKAATPPTHCTGSAAAPTAPSGYLCVYNALEEEPFGKPGSATFVGTNNGEEFSFAPGPAVGKEGALLNFETVHIGESTIPYAIAEGTWAVTAS